MLRRSLKIAFWVIYDHLGKLILANVLWVLAVLAPGSVAYALFPTAPLAGGILLALAAFVVLPMATAGLAYMVKVLIETHDGSVLDLFRGMRRHGATAVAAGLISALVVAAMTTSMWFYARGSGTSVPGVGYAVSALALWGLVFYSLVAMYLAPAIVYTRGGIWQVLKVAALLVLDNPALSVAWAVVVGCWTVVATVPLVAVLLSGSGLVVLVSALYEMLSRKYDAIELARNPQAERKRPVYVAMRDGRLVFDDEQDEYLNRNLRDALFPWKG